MNEVVNLNPVRSVLQDSSGEFITTTDTTSGKHAVDVNIAGGNVYVDATFSDIQIGAVEIKDAVTGDRVNVTIDSTKTAMYVQSESMASEATQLLNYSELQQANDYLADIRDSSGIKRIDEHVQVDLYDKDATGITSTNVSGKQGLDVNMVGGDIQIGAVEIKDADSSTRVDVELDTTHNAMFVQSDTLASDATQALNLAELQSINSNVFDIMDSSGVKRIDEHVQVDLYDKDASGITSTLVGGKQGLDVNMVGGDIHIGAVEIKDADSSVRSKVTDMGGGEGALDVNLIPTADSTVNQYLDADSASNAKGIVALGKDASNNNLEMLSVNDRGELIIAGYDASYNNIDIFGGVEITGPDGTVANVSDVGGQGALDVNLVGGDIQIGAIEIKDADSTTRAKVTDMGAGEGALDVRDADPLMSKKDSTDLFEGTILSHSYAYCPSVDCSEFNQAVFNVGYIQGDESSMQYKFQFSHDNTNWFDQVYEALGSSLVYTKPKEYTTGASIMHRIAVPLSDYYVRMGIKATGGTPDGTVFSSLTLGWS